MSKPEKYSHINFKPPSGARREAEYGLKLRREHGRGGTAVGIARARDLANGVELSPSTIRRMKAFFDRHASDEKAEGFRQGEKGFPSNGKIANLLWGGPSGYAFAKKVVAQMEAADAKAEGRALRPYGSTHGMKPRVIVVHGAPYSDKQKHVWSSVADNDVVFDYQKIVEAISGSNRNRQDLVSYCMDIRTAILRKSLKTPPQDGKVWVITTKVSDDLRRQLQDIPVEYVHIEASKSECLARLEKDDTRHPDDIEELRKVIEDYFSAEQRLAPATPGVERRFLGNFSQIEKADPSLLRVERRSDPQTGKPKTYIVGYAASFGRDSLLLGDFIERIEPSAFDIVKERVDGEGKPLETRCLYNHSPDHLLGRFPTTMRMTVDEKGLRYECLLPESRSDIAELIERGDLKGSSFSFVISDGGERWEIEDGKSIRVVTSIKSLLDCGPVVYPAYGDASVSVAKRSYEQFCEQRDCGRDDGGKFGPANKCQKDGEGDGESEPKKKGLGPEAGGALFGAAFGALLGPGAIPGAALGAVVGALSRMFRKSKESLPKMSEGEAREKLAGMMQASKIANKTKMMNDDQLTSMVRAAGPEATFKPSGKGDQIMISKPDGSVFHVSNTMRGEGGKTTLMYAGKGQTLAGSNNTAQISKPIDRAGISEAERLAKSAGIKKVVLFINEGDAKSQSAISAAGGFSKGGPAGKGFERYSKSLSSPSKRSAGTPASARAAKVSAEMRQFLEQRNCGTGSGGFQKGNSCGGGGGGKSSDDADTGAYTAPGSGSAFAIGAGIGAVAGGAVLGPLGAAAGGLAGGLVGSGLGHSRTEAAFNKASKAIGVTLGAIDSFARAISAELSISVGSNGEIVGNSDSGMSVTIQKYDETEVGKKLAGTTAHISSATSMVGKAGAESVSLLAKTLAKEGKKLGVKTLAVEVPMTGDKSQDRRTLSSYGDAGFDMNIKSDDGSKVTVFKTYTRSSRRSAVPAALEARDCGRAEGGRFGSGNECQKDGQGGQQQQAGKPKRLTAAQEGQEIAEMALLPVKLLGEVFGGLAKAKDPVLAKEASELVKATAAEVTKAKSPEGVAGVLRGFEKQFTQWASERLDVMIAKQGLRKKAVASRDCGRAPGGKFGSGNKCQADGSKYAEVSQDGNATAEDLQKFVDAAREGQLARGGKDGGQSDDGSGVQTWSKGDDYPWTTKQVGTDEGYLQAQHPDGSKTSKHPFTGGDTKPAFKSLQDELKRRKSSRSSQVIEETLAFLRERAQQ